ncbi:MAG: single-stranded-DNA-specific exonuclease RecJ [Chloroflexota bacterium]|nr:single-stranded-DNA-specific exonuclease RecJ [Chloroflexota bacterium]
MNGEWQRVEQPPVSPALRRAVGGHPLVARLLAQRGLTDPQRALAYLDPDHYSPASPYELDDLETARDLLLRAISCGERIRIWGDFDADGQTATAILYEALAARGARVDYQLPQRVEGHGLNERTVTEALADDISLLITCDTGITDGALVGRAVAGGLTVVITDHHDLPDELPPAHAVVNPERLPPDHPLRELSGAGVTYMMALALLEDQEASALLQDLVAFAALGLVADMVAQVDEVRYLIQRGLEALRSIQRPGLQAIFQMAELDQAHLDDQDVGYQVAPRLNAAGRLGDPETVVRLLLTTDAQEAQALAGELEALNRDRRARTEALLAQVQQRLQRSSELLHQPALILDGENWEEGILGLVASHLTQEYGRPAILIAHRPGRASVGSARSVEGVDIHQAIASQEEYLYQHGGHPKAAGFSMAPDNLPAFSRGLLNWLRKETPVKEMAPQITIEADLPWEEITLDLARDVARLAPFGEGNPAPTFAAREGTLIRTEDVSRNRETPHRRLYVSGEEGTPRPLVWFNAQEMPQPGERIDVAFRLWRQYWRGNERLQLEMVDWQPSAPTAQVERRPLVGGREIVDWRQRGPWREAIDELERTQGGDVAIWAENVADPLQKFITRASVFSTPLVALAILTPPPGPKALQEMLRRTDPQIVYLLPPYPTATPTTNAFLKQVAGMLRVALRAHGGEIDLSRMAARIGTRETAIMAALQGLEASGSIRLVRKGATLRAITPEKDLDRNGGAKKEETERRAESLHQARESLGYLLAEIEAYRRAYRTRPVEELFPATERR